MSVQQSVIPSSAGVHDEVADVLDPRTAEILELRGTRSRAIRRGGLVRRALLATDVMGLAVAFVAAEAAFPRAGGRISAQGELALFALTLPLWIVAAKVYGLYDRDEERTDHSTVDELVSVFHLVTVGAWALFGLAWTTGLFAPDAAKVSLFWLLALALVALGRGSARAVCRRQLTYLQNTIIVGAGDVGQLVARKYSQHPEYGINLVGFVDDRPKERRPDLGHLTLLGGPDQLPALVRLLDVERVVIAFSNERAEKTVELVRSLGGLNVQIDVVPRLFELLGPRVGVHTVEGTPLLGLPPVRQSRSSRVVKRALDIVGASIGLLLTAPLMASIAWRIRRDSPGPVLFRQTRLGMNQREFTMLKFRSMQTDTDRTAHEAYIAATAAGAVSTNGDGLFKLERHDTTTSLGHSLRKTSMDELPQLWNVLRGDMSLVGPRPCLRYETQHFKPHHFERFTVPAGLTGLWQVTARARATFGEALDLDVAYVRGWSLGLDLTLVLRTVRHLAGRGQTA